MNTYVILCYEGREVLNVVCCPTLDEAKQVASKLTQYEGFVIWEYDGKNTQAILDGDFPRRNAVRVSNEIEWTTT